MGETHEEAHEREERCAESARPGDVDAFDDRLRRQRLRRVFRRPEDHEDRGEQRERQVDGEDRVPSERAGENAAEQRTDRHRADRGKRKKAHRCARRRNVEPVGLDAEHAHRCRIRAGGADAEHDARDDEHVQRRREPADDAGKCDEGERAQQYAARTEEIGQAPHRRLRDRACEI